MTEQINKCKKRQTSHVEEFQIIYLDSTLNDVENNFPPLKCGLYTVTSFQRVQYIKGERKKKTFKKPDKH